MGGGSNNDVLWLGEMEERRGEAEDKKRGKRWKNRKMKEKGEIRGWG